MPGCIRLRGQVGLRLRVSVGIRARLRARLRARVRVRVTSATATTAIPGGEGREGDEERGVIGAGERERTEAGRVECNGDGERGEGGTA